MVIIFLTVASIMFISFLAGLVMVGAWAIAELAIKEDRKEYDEIIKKMKQEKEEE